MDKKVKEHKKFILVATHTRSGTHFLMNSLCMNFRNMEFPYVRNANASLVGLFLTHDGEYTKEWEKHVFEEKGKTKIFKTHLSLSEILAGLNNKLYMGDREWALLKFIYENSYILYGYRDGRDVLVSFYYYQKNHGGGLPKGAEYRLSECTFSEFIRMPNKYYTPVRGFEGRDENRCKYWSSHVEEWLSNKDVIPLKYETLHKNFEGTVRELAVTLSAQKDLADTIRRPGLRQFSKTDIWSRGIRRAKRVISPLLDKVNISIPKFAPPGYPRKGIVGDWKNHFSESDTSFFLEFSKKTMHRLGYIQDE